MSNTEEPNLDDIVNILVRRMETHPDDFGEYTGLGRELDDLPTWKEAKLKGEAYVGELDFFDDEQLERLYAARTEHAKRQFVNNVMQQVFRKEEAKDVGVIGTLTGQTVYSQASANLGAALTGVNLQGLQTQMDYQRLALDRQKIYHELAQAGLAKSQEKKQP